MKTSFLPRTVLVLGLVSFLRACLKNNIAKIPDLTIHSGFQEMKP